MDRGSSSPKKQKRNEDAGISPDRMTRRLVELNRRDHTDGSGSTPLHSAVSKNDVNKVRKLITAGVSVDKVDCERQTPLHYAVERDFKECAIQLLKAGANPEVCNESKHSEQMGEILFQWGAVRQPSKRNGQTRLHLAAARGFVDVLEVLLKDIENIDEHDHDGESALHYAAKNNQAPAITLLLQHKANVLVYAKDVSTALHVAADANAVEAAKVLLSLEPSILKEKDARNRTSFHRAAGSGCTDVLQLLLSKHDKKVGLESDDCKKHPLHIAAEKGHGPSVGIILRYFQDIINKKDDEGRTALHHAVKKRGIGHQAVVVILLEKKADANIPDHQGDTPLHKVVKECFRGVDYQLLLMIHHLIDGNADPSILDQDGHTCIDLVEKKMRHDRQRDNVIAALFPKPPEGKLLPKVEWYRCLARQGRDLLRLIREHKLQPLDKDRKRCTFWPVENVDTKRAKELLCEARVYPMTAKTRGRAVILNITTFMKNKDRTGTEPDVQRLRRVFMQLGFDVKDWENFTAEELKEKIKAEKRDRIHASADAFVFIIMTHGGRGYIECKDGDQLQISEDIVDPFNGSNWPLLNNKPKIFLIQACRGKRRERPSLTRSQSQSQSLFEVDASLPVGVSATYPNEARPYSDIIKIFSTYEGCTASRPAPSKYSQSQGSWFIEEFCLMTELFAHEDDLDEIVKKANQILGHRKGFYTDGVQTANLDSTQTRRLYFFPGYHK